MDPWTFTLLITVCYGLYYCFKKKHHYFDEFGIPYLPSWPIFGNMGSAFFRQKHISELLCDIYNLNPEAKYVGMFDFGRPLIMIRDPELIKSVTIKNFDNFPDHKAFIDDTIDPLFGSNLFNIAGNRWRESRNLLSPAFTSSKMKAMFELIVECGKNFVNYVSEQSVEANKNVATKILFGKFTNDVIASCAFGISIDSLKNPNNEFYLLGREATNLDGILSFKFFVARSFPQIMKIFNIKFVNDHVGNFFKNVVGSTVAMRDEKSISRPDMLQLMMDARGKKSEHLKLDITEMTAQAFSFFFGGFDTTSTQMCIIAHELAINSDIQKRLQDDIDDILRESGGKPTYEMINGMPYLDAVFNESLRRHTQVPFLDRLCTEAFELPPAVPGAKPFTVKPGMNIWISPSAIHMDPKIYNNPTKFDPDRYYEKKVSVNDVQNLGFGIGPRSCIGNRFAILETKILFFFLLSKFNLKPNSNTCIPLKYKKNTFSIVAEGGFWLSVEPRN